MNKCAELEMTNQEKEIESIKQTLEDYAIAYCAKDIEAIMQVFDASNNISVFGTGARELCVGRDQVKSLFLDNFEEATAQIFEWTWIDIRLSNNHAVASVTLILHLNYKGKEMQVPIRWTVVLKHQNERWVWLHRNASTAANNQDEGQAYPKEKIIWNES
jgi:ketosteroid isomerase-like protein